MALLLSFKCLDIHSPSFGYILLVDYYVVFFLKQKLVLSIKEFSHSKLIFISLVYSEYLSVCSLSPWSIPRIYPAVIQYPIS